MKLRRIWLALTIVLLLVAASSPARAAVFPPNSSPNGNTYAEWNALWWRWFLAIPLNENPVNGGACSTGQVGSVWFLAGIPGTNIVRCTIPSGKSLFFPLINTECSNREGPPFFGANQAARRSCAKRIVDGASNLTASVDGAFIPNIKSFRSSSPNSLFVVPPNNVLGVPPAFGALVGDGYYVMLAPLSPGKHIIRITGSFPAFDFDIDTTFELNVLR